jgi:uncharacterized Tic20 family protein
MIPVKRATEVRKSVNLDLNVVREENMGYFTDRLLLIFASILFIILGVLLIDLFIETLSTLEIIKRILTALILVTLSGWVLVLIKLKKTKKTEGKNGNTNEETKS